MTVSDQPATFPPGLTGTRARVADRVRAVPLRVWVLGALTFLAAVIRIITIDNQSIWADEALTAYEAQLPLGAMIHTVATVETSPPLYFVLMWAWVHVFGDGDVALRTISTLSGIALVPISYLAARELVSVRAGLIAAALVAVNPFLIWYSQEARPYMLLAALSGASFLFFARTLRARSRRNLVCWGAFSCLALMTHFFAGFLVAPEAAWLLWRLRDRATAAAIAAIGVVELAMVRMAVTDTGHGVDWLRKIPVTHRVSRTVLEWTVSLLERKGNVPIGLLVVVAVSAAVLWLLGVGGDGPSRRGAAIAAAIAGFVLIAPLTLELIGQDYYYPRNEIPAFVPVVTVVAAACAAPRARSVGLVLAVAQLSVLSAAATYVQTHPYLQRPDWHAVADALGATRAPRAIVAADGTTAQPLKIYLSRVSWVQRHSRRVLVGEIDIVGSQKLVPIVPKERRVVFRGHTARGRPYPVENAPSGTTLVSRLRVHNWVLARFVLHRPERLSVNALVRLAPRYFQHVPTRLLVFFQRAP